jgi:tetratricopeptide (TPR) repeat protein
MKKIGYLLVIILCFISYSNTLNHSYAHDDAIVIVHNDKIKKGISGIPELFKNRKTQDIQDRYGYRPITLTSFALEYEFFPDRPEINHFTNLIIYTTICCLLFYLLMLIFKERSYEMALLATVLFVVHPIHTEVVANIKSRDELLMMLFGILACIAFLKAKEAPSIKAILLYSTTLICCLLSFISKENGVVFIGVLFLINTYQNNFKIQVNKSLMLIVLCLALLLLLRAFYTSDYFFDNESMSLTYQGVYYEDGFLGNPLLGESNWLTRIPNAFYILLWYLKLLIWPDHLVHDYGYGYSQVIGWSSIQVWLSLILHIFLALLLICKRKSKSPVVFGVLFYFITIFIYLHLVQVSPDYMAERYLFVPSLGFCLIISWGIIKVIHHINIYIVNYPFIFQSLMIIALSFLICMLTLRTRERNEDWKNNDTLYSADINLLKDNARANYNYALMLENKYRNNLSIQHQKEIITFMERSLAISNRSLNIRSSYALKLLEMGKEKEAVFELKQLIYDFPYNILPTKYLASIYIEKEQYTEALEIISKKDAFKIENADLMYLKAVCLIKTGHSKKAYQILQKASLTFPENESLHALREKFSTNE